MSASVNQTPCAATVQPVKTPNDSSAAVGVILALGERFVVLGLGF